jgi:hypothetical protein
MILEEQMVINDPPHDDVRDAIFLGMSSSSGRVNMEVIHF